MRTNNILLNKLENYYSGYIEGKKLDEFFKDFDIKFATGHWAAGDFMDRFATKGYNPEIDSSIISQMKRVAKAGINGIEFHDSVFIDENYKPVESIINSVKEELDGLKLIPTVMNINLWTDPKWKMGGLTNPSKKIREEALNIALQAIDIAKQIGCKAVSLWPGSDGWDYNFETNYGKLLELFLDGLTEINKEAKRKGLKFGMEAKPHEPREGNMIVPTTHIAGLIVKEVNNRCSGNNMGVTIDYGHEQMYAVEPAATVYFLNKLEVPIANFHINTAKLHSNDEDRVAGTGDVWRFIDFLYASIDIEYNGWFAEDQFTYRMDPVGGMRLSKELFGNLMKKALRIYSRKKELEEIRETGDQVKILDFVKKFILY